MITDVFATWVAGTGDESGVARSFTVYCNGGDVTAQIALAQVVTGVGNVEYFYGAGGLAYIHRTRSSTHGSTTYSDGERSVVNLVHDCDSITFEIAAVAFTRVHATIMIFFH